MFKKISQKITSTVKEGVAEEASKTADEMKENVKDTARSAAPYIIGGLIVVAIAVVVFRRPCPVKLVIKLFH